MINFQISIQLHIMTRFQRKLWNWSCTCIKLRRNCCRKHHYYRKGSIYSFYLVAIFGIRHEIWDFQNIKFIFLFLVRKWCSYVLTIVLCWTLCVHSCFFRWVFRWKRTYIHLQNCRNTAIWMDVIPRHLISRRAKVLKFNYYYKFI